MRIRGRTHLLHSSYVIYICTCTLQASAESGVATANIHTYKCHSVHVLRIRSVLCTRPPVNGPICDIRCGCSLCRTKSLGMGRAYVLDGLPLVVFALYRCPFLSPCSITYRLLVVSSCGVYNVRRREFCFCGNGPKCQMSWLSSLTIGICGSCICTATGEDKF